jgi:hypothetical protein
MGSDGNYYYQRHNPCPVCRDRHAYMGSSEWRPFRGMACSEECGLKAKAAVEAAQATPRWKQLNSRRWNDKFRIAEIECAAVESIAPPPSSEPSP